MKKRIFCIFLAIVAAVCLIGCGNKANQKNSGGTNDSAANSSETDGSAADDSGSGQEEAQETTGDQVELIVFAAASMTESLHQIAELYQETAPDVTLVFNLDSSGTLKTQIEEGADCDLFISAAQKQMDQLDVSSDKEVNPTGLDFVDQGTRIDLLENKVVLCVAEGNPAGVQDFDGLAKALADSKILMAMGNSDVPVGQYTQKILEYYRLNEEELANAGKISYGTNVKEVLTQIMEGSVDCGVVYKTDAVSAGLEPEAYADSEMCGQVIYPAAVLKCSRHPDEAKAFLDYLATDKAMEIFEGVGFSAVE